jgi:flagellar hook-associated protein 3 FlgL
MVNRVATFAFTNQMVAENMRLQSKYADINTQISSGLKSQDYKGIARDSQYLLAVESSQTKLVAYNANANIASSKINIMYSTIGKIEDMANSMLSNITASIAGNQVPSAVTGDQANNALLETSGLLNTKIGGQYLFAGSDIDTTPVDLSDPAWPAQTSPSTANSSYYQGNSTLATVQVSETYTTTYGVTADNTAFEKLFRAYNILKTNPTGIAERTEASDLIKSSIADIGNIRGILSTKANSIQDQTDKNELDRTDLQELSSSIKETDIPSASVRLTEIQGQLEASYSASVRVLQLSLVNYL